ncbi:hypothetical protein CEXT_78111 [Caerostris extrusa]|uniref:Uncharacterized protein n=1 Tax=Caerostris extrusa TaxID=172846 RepID=A0AAV4T924_CAEEX|nr:hypothetical protein CEXT_78111 [Caerostris extrusa]
MFLSEARRFDDDCGYIGKSSDTDSLSDVLFSLHPTSYANVEKLLQKLSLHHQSVAISRTQMVGFVG